MRRGKASPNTSRSRRSKPRSNNPRGGDYLRRGDGATSVSALNRITSVSVPRGINMFPDQFYCWGVTNYSLLPVGVATVTNTFKVNSPNFEFGPQTNYSGAFSVNVPAGINYLLSSQQALGSAAPYSWCTVTRVVMELDITTNGAIPLYVTATPSTINNLAGMPQTTQGELRGSTQLITTSADTSRPMRMTNSFNISDLFGVSHQTIHNDPQFKSTYNSSPNAIAYLHLALVSIDGTTNFTAYCNVKFRLQMVFSNINPFNSTPSALLSPTPSNSPAASAPIYQHISHPGENPLLDYYIIRKEKNEKQ